MLALLLRRQGAQRILSVVNDDLNGDDKIRRFEDLGRRLFQVPKEEVESDNEATEEEPQADE